MFRRWDVRSKFINLFTYTFPYLNYVQIEHLKTNRLIRNKSLWFSKIYWRLQTSTHITEESTSSIKYF